MATILGQLWSLTRQRIDIHHEDVGAPARHSNLVENATRYGVELDQVRIGQQVAVPADGFIGPKVGSAPDE